MYGRPDSPSTRMVQSQTARSAAYRYERRAVPSPCHLDPIAIQGVADEVADGEVGIQWQQADRRTRSSARSWPRDPSVPRRRSRGTPQRACRGRTRRMRPRDEARRRTPRGAARSPAVACRRPRRSSVSSSLPRPTAHGEVEDPLGPLDGRPEGRRSATARAASRSPCAARACSRAVGAVERPDVARVQRHGRVPGDMRRGSANRRGSRVSTMALGAQTQLVVRPEEALQHPAAEEPGAAGHEQATAAQVVPEALGVLQDVVQVRAPAAAERLLPGIGPDVARETRRARAAAR